MSVGAYSFDQFLELVKNFHGYAAPGVVLGGVMVEAGRERIPADTLFDAVSETPKCLPDAIQLLTPCTIGNGWLKVFNLGRYALSLYDKYQGHGIRVFVDAPKLEGFPHIKTWLYKLSPKSEQDSERLIREIEAAGEEILGFGPVQVGSSLLQKKTRDRIATCSLCGEAYPKRDGGICRACQGEAPYRAGGVGAARQFRVPEIETVPVRAAVGKKVLHDMTRIVPHELKQAEFKAGQRLTAGDVCRLQQMGRERIFIQKDEPHTGWVHENDAARAFAAAMAGAGVDGSGQPSEGKVTIRAEHNGLLAIERDIMEKFNLVPDVMCASRQNYSLVEGGKEIAGTRAIPLYISSAHFQQAMAVLGEGEMFQVRPLRKARVGILVTGSEIAQGLIEDKFAPIIANKVQNLGCSVVGTRIVPDDREAIREGVTALLEKRADLIVGTAGLSVDPDDVTRQGLVDAGLSDMIYGAPVLPGAMTMLGRIGQVQVMGVPACALFFKTTSFDLLLPRLLAGMPISRKDLAQLAEGGLCLNCKACTFPKCPFGK